jgi:hypothetical protein
VEQYQLPSNLKNMKKLLNTILIIALLASATSCKKSYLDINANPNSATASTPELVLPAALTTTGSLLVTYLDYGNFMAGYQSNAGGYSFTGSTTVTYAFTTGNNTGLYSGPFSNLRDYQYIITNTTGIPKYALFNAAARIMKSYHYQKLVDEYGDVPYSDALQGANIVTPKYDDDAAVYQALITDLDACIAQLKANISNSTVTTLGTSDVMFQGNVTKWIQFANNIKLRLLTRARSSSISAFVATEFGTFSSEGFLTDDVVINPGYSSASAIQNPMWTTYHSSYTGTAAGAGLSRIPSPFIMAFYNGVKVTDTKRGALIYKNFGTTPVNQLGNENSPVAVAGYPAWYVGTGTGASAPETVGILKSRVMPQIIFPASETYFLLAEAALNGYTLSGSAQSNFDLGVRASFNYLEKFGSTNAVPATSTPAADATAYQASNPTNYLVNYNLATTYAQRLEAIITQKYVALNFVDSYEGWTEFRRTTYPTIVNGSTSATASFASLQSASTRADKLTVRSLYPQNEYNLNANTPAGLSVFTSKVFWDPASDSPATN